MDKEDRILEILDKLITGQAKLEHKKIPLT